MIIEAPPDYLFHYAWWAALHDFEVALFTMMMIFDQLTSQKKPADLDLHCFQDICICFSYCFQVVIYGSA